MSIDNAVWHVDPGHGWLQVPIESCLDLPLQGYYVQDSYAFLEEDCEAGVWLCHHGFIDGEITIDPYPHVVGFTQWLIGDGRQFRTIYHDVDFPRTRGLGRHVKTVTVSNW